MNDQTPTIEGLLAERQKLINELFKVSLELAKLEQKVIETWPLDDQEEHAIYQEVWDKITTEFGSPTNP